MGSIVRSLPLDGKNEADINILLTKNNLQKETTSPRISAKKISETTREDFTDQPSILLKSWQSNNAPGLPAIHAVPHEGGTKVWIHVPSVCERFSPGGKIEEYLKEKGESICLGSKWRKLLNESLTKASEFKINTLSESITLMFEIDKEGEILNWQFSLSRIKPVCEINQEQLIAIKNKKPKSKTLPISIKPIKDYLEQVYTIINCSKVLNTYEKKNGAIKLDHEIPSLESINELQKVYPGRDFYGWSQDLDVEDPQSILNTIINKSNQILYQHLKAYNLPAIVKEYEQIDDNSLNEIAKSAISLDTEIKLNQDGDLNTCDLLKSFSESQHKRILHKIVRHAVPGINLKSLNINKSDSDLTSISEMNNTQASINIHAPWCCPTLNYWDIYNQSIIVFLLTEGKNKASSRAKEIIDLGKDNSWNSLEWDLFSNKNNDIVQSSLNNRLIDELNEKRRKTRSFRNNMVSMAQAREAEKILNNEVDALITGVQSYGFFAEIEKLGTEGLVHVSTLGDDWYEYRSRQNLLIGRKNKKTFQLAQKIKVKVVKVDLLKNQVDLEMINPKENTETEKLEETVEKAKN